MQEKIQPDTLMQELHKQVELEHALWEIAREDMCCFAEQVHDLKQQNEKLKAENAALFQLVQDTPLKSDPHLQRAQ
jgi:hypothetical protein